MSNMLDNSFQGRYNQLPIATYTSREPVREVTTQFCHEHYHREFETLVIWAGSCDFTIGGTTYRAREGDILLVPPYSLHAGSCPPGAPFEYFCLSFDLALLGEEKLTRMLENGELDVVHLIPRTDPMSPKLRHLLGTIFRQSEERAEGWDLIVRGQELTFFGLLRQSGAIVAADSRATKSKFGLSVLDILGSAYQENITFKDVAQLMSYSHSYFCRKFRDTFSMSFQQYLSQYRLSKARMFLAQGGMTVGQVAEQVGYRSVNFFSRSFRELYGCTPGQFQKEHFRTPTVAEAAGERERQGP